MSYRFRIAAWVIVSSFILMGLTMFTTYRHLEEELRQGRSDPTHPPVPGWTLHQSYSEAEIQDILGELTERWLLTAAPVILLALAAGLLLARRSLKPVHDINRQLAEMRPDSLHGDIRISEADPTIEDLSRHLNGLLDRAGLAYQEMAEFSARVAHELRTPLMLLRLRVENAPPGIPPDFQEDLQDELGRLSRFVERSLLAAKAEQGSLTPSSSPVSLSDLVREVVEDYQLIPEGRTIEITLDVPDNLVIQTDPDFLRQALRGLMENSIQYSYSSIQVSCRREDGGHTLEIRNDLNPATLATSGLGLGLRVVGGICKACKLPFHIRKTDHDFTATIQFNPKNNAS